MDWEVAFKGIGLLLFGALFIWLGLIGWRVRREERISLIEAAILKAGGEDEPMTFNRWDRAWATIQPILMLIFGPLMIFFGLAVLSLLGE